MPNRPGRPRGGPGLAQRATQYKALRERGLTYEEAAQAMDVSRAAICQYARRLRDVGELPPVPRSSPKPPPPPRPPSRYRTAVLEYLRRWPNSLFSAWELRRILGSNVDWVLRKLTHEGLIEVVDGMRYPSDQKVPARRYRLAASARLSPAPAVQDTTPLADDPGVGKTSEEVR